MVFAQLKTLSLNCILSILSFMLYKLYFRSYYVSMHIYFSSSSPAPPPLPLHHPTPAVSTLVFFWEASVTSPGGSLLLFVFLCCSAYQTRLQGWPVFGGMECVSDSVSLFHIPSQYILGQHWKCSCSSNIC